MNNNFDYYGIFEDLFSENKITRDEYLNDLINTLKLCLYPYDENKTEEIIKSPILKEQVKHGRRFLDLYLPSLTLLVERCPFENICNDIKQLLIELNTSHDVILPVINYNISKYVSNSQITPINVDDIEKKTVLQELYTTYGQINHLEQMLAWHPSFLKVWSVALHSIMYSSDLTLSENWKHYIAIMGASRFRCEYLVNKQEQLLLDTEKDCSSWVKNGIDNVPAKLRALVGLNAKLCHRPWLITEADIEELITEPDVEERWNVQEVAYAMLILCTFHSMSGLVYGLGICEEVNLRQESLQWLDPDSIPSSVIDHEDENVEEKHTEMLVELLQSTSNNNNNEYDNNDIDLKAFDEAGIIDDGKLDSESVELNSKCDKHGLTAYPLKYKNFNVSSDPTFRTNQWTWSPHGVELLDQWCPGIDIGSKLDEVWNNISGLTYHKVNNTENVDTSLFREALWNYAHRLFGVQFDDYNYENVNRFLNIEIKTFVKKICCNPQSITSSDFHNIGYQLTPAEKCHVVLIACESHRQSSLMYGLYALNKFQNK